ncbi:glycosyltransferase family 87 protein [Telluribacter humicola]|uniref:glycosyltransferase family 87 protein n=1 Tax=Telluribacter humicola TaxID=1720261 RepID=UPI001A97B132|nr:glycosyltransferase family 87 protein [Telluribacter humicola]
MKDWATKALSNQRSLLILYITIALAASIQALLSGTKTFDDSGTHYTSYNNYRIFEQSFYHLLNNQDLYILYPQEHWDLYKYTPTFSALFGLFALFPDWAGLSLWNLANVLVLLFAVYRLPHLRDVEKGLLLVIVLLELLTSIQNSQSNGLIAGLLVLAFGLLEDKKYLWATLCIVFSAFIKLFGVVGFALFLFYPRKEKLALYTSLWAVVLFLIPLAFVSYEQYIRLFQSYWNMLSHDHSSSYGYSVMGWWNSWFGMEVNKNLIVLVGVLLFLLPLIRYREYQNYTFRYLALCSILIWIVIFNHKAESPTFIIAMTGVALWFVTAKKDTLTIILFACAFVLTTLSPTDVFPRYLREEFVVPYTLKAFPCILVWVKVVYDMIVLKKDCLTERTYPQQHPLQAARP